MMDSIIEKLALQVPAIIALVVLMVIMFRYLAARDLFIRQLHEEHMMAREDSRKALETSTDVMRELTRVIEKMLLTNGR